MCIRDRICPVLFSPDAYKPNEDVKWWMPIPEDGWHDVKNEPPKEGAMCLIMGMYAVSYTHLDVYKRQELQTVGYLIREQSHDSGGKFGGNV